MDDNKELAAMLKVVSPEELPINLDEYLRRGAQKMLLKALEDEVSAYIDDNSDVDGNGHRMVVRNGQGKTRSVTTGSGVLSIEAPRINDRREGRKFTSSILPPYLRKSPKIESLLPILYLKGISTSKVADALKDFLGEDASGLSSSAVSKILKTWQKDFDEWKRRPILKKYAYIWADGVNVQIRLGDDKKLCLLVIIGVAEDGSKELLAVSPGYRESKDSWLCVMRSLVERGLHAPVLAVGDGALGFWAALRECDGFKLTKEQRCWVHKIANVLDKLPKRVQPDVKSLLHEMMKAPDVESAEKAKNRFVNIYEDKYSKAVKCLIKDWARLITFFDLPAAHWQSVRSTNPIESSFSSVKLRTRVTRGAGSSQTAGTLAFKLLLECEKKWRKLRSPELVIDVINGVDYKDGIVLSTPSTDQEDVAS
jgi:putative transposase